MNRAHGLDQANSRSLFDLVVIGGGATGLGVAWDASLRGLSVLLLEGEDFAGGTSSRSTKLIHGGIRYLRQGHINLVRESLREKAWLLQKAPELVHPLRFVIPCRNWWEGLIYGIGTSLYSRLGNSRSHRLSRPQLKERFPHLRTDRFFHGVDYVDAQFDDARMAVTLAQEIHRNGGIVLNYCPVEALGEFDGTGRTVSMVDSCSGRHHTYRARMVVNATGVQADRIRRLVAPGTPNRIQASRGSHLVLRGQVLGSQQDALIIPKTEDGRVIFLIPWLGRSLIGTTEVEVSDVAVPPRVSAAEVDYLLDHIQPYLSKPVGRTDVSSVFAGYRPLISCASRSVSSKRVRDFEIEHTGPGVISVLGGKWTTFRAMAEVAVDRAIHLLELPPIPCSTRAVTLRADRFDIESDPDLDRPLSAEFPYRWRQVRRAVRQEMAISLEDVLARRTRCLFLDAAATRAIAPQVARFMALELGHPDAWVRAEVARFELIARPYEVP